MAKFNNTTYIMSGDRIVQRMEKGMPKGGFYQNGQPRLPLEAKVVNKTNTVGGRFPDDFSEDVWHLEDSNGKITTASSWDLTSNFSFSVPKAELEKRIDVHYAAECAKRISAGLNPNPRSCYMP